MNRKGIIKIIKIHTPQFFTQFLIMFAKISYIYIWMSQKHGCESCHYVTVPWSLYHWIHEEGWYVRQNHPIHHAPTSFCSPLVKSEPTWLHTQELKCQVNKYFFHINRDRSNQLTDADKVFAYLPHLQAKLSLQFSTPHSPPPPPPPPPHTSPPTSICEYHKVFTHVVVRFLYKALFSALEQTHCVLSCVILNGWLSLFVVHFEYAIWLLGGRCHMKLLPSQHTFCVHHTANNHAPADSVTSFQATYIRYMCI